MWQAPNQRLRAQANARKRERDRYKNGFHIKRVVANIRLQIPGAEPKTIEARTLLNDFSPRGMGLFSGHQFSQGDEITVTIESPQKIEVKGRVMWCQEYFVVGKILKNQSFSYRAGVQFRFASADEEAAVRRYCDDLLNTHRCISLRLEGSAEGSVEMATPASAAPAADATVDAATPAADPAAAAPATESAGEPAPAEAAAAPLPKPESAAGSGQGQAA